MPGASPRCWSGSPASTPATCRCCSNPQPRAVLDALDRLLREADAASHEAVLFFYYSGHADDAALYPAGRTLPMADLKPRLEDPRAKVRIGIIDSCRGGGWTGTKGLTAAEPFDVNVPLGLSNEGSISDRVELRPGKRARIGVAARLFLHPPLERRADGRGRSQRRRAHHHERGVRLCAHADHSRHRAGHADAPAPELSHEPERAAGLHAPRRCDRAGAR